MTVHLPTTAPFTYNEIEALSAIVARSNSQQRTWLSGFLAGIDANTNTPALPLTDAEPRVKEKLLVLYASETGNAEALARKARKIAARQGFEARVMDMADATLDELAASRNLLIYVATWGEGDPPQRAQAFYDAVLSEAAPQLPNLRYGVLGLGDSAYINFCETARVLDERLAMLGAERTIDRIELDLDFAKQAAAWTDTSLTALAPAKPTSPATIVHVDFANASQALDDDEPAYGADRPLEAEITEIVNLNGTGSTAETWHLEFATDVAGFTYEPGDSIGVAPQNDPQLVADLITAAGLDHDPELVARLTRDRDITTLTRPVIKAYADITGRDDVAVLAEPEHLATYIADRQIIDLVAEHSERLSAEQLIGMLRPLPPRLYSVASSLAAHPGETHLLVGAVNWRSHGRERKGVASHWLAGRREGDTVDLHVKPNRHFRLPEDSDRPIIMIGAGTGIAPFRAFIDERAERRATGKSWLFFGARNFTTDFLYQLEWQEHLASGTLSTIDVAFSRDQPEKIYVQDRIAARADTLRGWVEDGAHIYVCGDEKAMAKDVENALVAMLAGPAQDLEAGHAQLTALQTDGRYQRDVY